MNTLETELQLTLTRRGLAYVKYDGMSGSIIYRIMGKGIKLTEAELATPMEATKSLIDSKIKAIFP